MQNIQMKQDSKFVKVCVMGKLRRADVIITKQRVALATLLFNESRGHFTAEKLYSEAKKVGLQISLATIYNTLNHFSDQGLIKTLQIDNSKTFFDTNTHHHYHFRDGNDLHDVNTKDVTIDLHKNKIPNGKKIKSIDVIINLTDE